MSSIEGEILLWWQGKYDTATHERRYQEAKRKLDRYAEDRVIEALDRIGLPCTEATEGHVAKHWPEHAVREIGAIREELLTNKPQ